MSFYIFDVVNMRGLNALISDKRNEALQDVKRAYPCAFSRGTFLNTVDANWNQCEPRVEAACPVWHGTRKEIDDLITLVKEKYPEVAIIQISGGYDGAESPYAYRELEDYEPWASAWYEAVWER